MNRGNNPQLKVVIDTKVIISAAISPYGHPAKIFEMLLLGEIENFTSEEMLEELIDVLHREEIAEKMSESQREFMIHHAEIFSVKLKPTEKMQVISEDPDDDKIVECAVFAGAQYIISGDEHLLKLHEFRGIKMVTPAYFCSIMERVREKHD